MPQMDRAEHLQWCKDRAIEYLPGDPQQAFASMTSDLRKHEETDNPTLALLGASLLLGGQMETPEQVRKWIEGFN